MEEDEDDLNISALTLLYDLRNDPQESNNVAAQYLDIVKRLEAEHAKWNNELPPPDESILPAIRSTLIDVDGKTVQLIF